MFWEKNVVCFLGDSITASGLWMAEAYQHLRRSHKMKIFNCGVSGGTATNALLHMHSQCLVYNPTHVVIMFGVNDIARTNYTPSVRDN